MKAANGDSIKLLGRLAEGIDDILNAEMSSTLHDLAESGPTMGGELAALDIPLLLGRVFLEGRTGRLRVGREDVEKSVYFEAGLPVMAASQDATDRMLAMLTREGVLDARQSRETERVADATGRKVGVVLVDLGFLRSDELLPAVRRHYESIILSLFSWVSGRWQMDPDVTAGPERTRLLRHPIVLVREGLMRYVTASSIATRLGIGRSTFLLHNTGQASELGFLAAVEKAELRVPSLFDGVRSVEEVARASGLSEAVVGQIAFALSCFDVLRPVEPGGGAGDESGRGLRDLSIERERVQARYALAMDSDYFKVLGLDRRADDNDVRRAYDRLCKEISPESLGPGLWHEMRLPIESIREVLQEGLRVLSTPALRAAYAFNLAHGPDADQGEESSVSTLESPDILRR